MKIDAMRQHYQTILGDIPEEEMMAKINAELVQYGEIDVVFIYRSDTSDEDLKYSTPENQLFEEMSKKKRQKHILSLWRLVFNKTRGCNVIITQF